MKREEIVKRRILPLEEEWIRFLAPLRFEGFERGLLDTLLREVDNAAEEECFPVISRKQRTALWRIPLRYNIPEIKHFAHREIVCLIGLIIESIEYTHKTYWAGRVASELEASIKQQLDKYTRLRSEWLENTWQEAEPQYIEQLRAELKAIDSEPEIEEVSS